MAFEVYGEQLKTVPSFKYLGRILTAGDDDWPAVTGNLGKAQKSWGRLQQILSREGGKQESVGELLLGGGPTGTTVWGRDVGGDAKNGAGAELLHAWGCETDHGETATERVGREMVLPLPGGDHEGSRF